MRCIFCSSLESDKKEALFINWQTALRMIVTFEVITINWAPSYSLFECFFVEFLNYLFTYTSELSVIPFSCWMLMFSGIARYDRRGAGMQVLRYHTREQGVAYARIRSSSWNFLQLWCIFKVCYRYQSITGWLNDFFFVF